MAVTQNINLYVLKLFSIFKLIREKWDKQDRQILTAKFLKDFDVQIYTIISNGRRGRVNSVYGISHT